jgi:hypothetical protein
MSGEVREKGAGRREQPAGRLGAFLLAVALALVLVFAAACGDSNGGEDESALPRNTVRIAVSGETGALEELVVELALTQEERALGLMHRQELAEDAGMFFVFEGMVRTGFWMKDTYVPLDIAFLSEEGKVQQIIAGEPLNEELLQPVFPYRYVLEVNQGWFERHGLGEGAIVKIPDEVRAAGT